MAIVIEMTNEIEFACNERSKSNETCAVSVHLNDMFICQA